MYVVYVFDIIIAISYFAIPLQIAYFTFRLPLQDFKTQGTLLLFCTFIVLCGFTHLFHAVRMAKAMQIVYGLTAVVSAITAVALIGVIPHVLKLPLKLEHIRKQGEIDVKYRFLIQKLHNHTQPIRDTQLLNVAKLLLRNLYPKKYIQVVLPRQTSSRAVHCVATDGYQSLIIDKKVYNDNQWLLDEFGNVLNASVNAPLPLPGIERESIV